MLRIIKPRVSLRAVILASVLVPGIATAQPLPPGPVQVANPNAALQYWPAWVQIPADVREKMGKIDWDKVYAAGSDADLPQEYRDAASFDLLLNVAGDLMRVSKFERCDFEIRYDDGFMAVLPHLSYQRTGERALRVAAHESLRRGDVDRAAAFVGAMVRSAAHLAGDRVLISSLVGTADGMAACEEGKRVLASPKLSADARQELLSALRALDTGDPMGIRAALAFEASTIPRYMERTYRGPKSGQEIAALLKELNSPGPEAENALAQVAGMDEAAIKRELGQVTKVYEEIYAAWNLDADASKLREINDRVKSGARGPLAQVLCPSVEKAFQSAKKFRETLRATMLVK